MPDRTGSAAWRLVVAGMAAATVVAVDLGTKQVATATLDDGPLQLTGPLWLRLGHNTGVAFGLGDNAPTWVIATLAIIVSATIAVVAWRSRIVSPIVLAVVLGGALANLIDRLDDAAVVDMIDIGPWPTFNVADIAITAGLGLALYGHGRTRRNEPPAADPI